MKIIPKLSKFPVFGFWFKFEVQAKVKGEIKIVGISGVNFGNLQINFELKTSGDDRYRYILFCKPYRSSYLNRREKATDFINNHFRLLTRSN